MMTDKLILRENTAVRVWDAKTSLWADGLVRLSKEDGLVVVINESEDATPVGH